MNLPPISEEEKSLIKSIFCIQQILSLKRISNQIQINTNILITDLETLISKDDEKDIHSKIIGNQQSDIKRQFNQGIDNQNQNEQSEQICNDDKKKLALSVLQRQQFVQIINGKIHFHILGKFEDIFYFQICDFITLQNQTNEDVFYEIKQQQLPILGVQEQIKLNVKKMQSIIAQRMQDYYQILNKTINWTINQIISDQYFPFQEMKKLATKIIVNNFKAFFKTLIASNKSILSKNWQYLKQINISVFQFFAKINYKNIRRFRQFKTLYIILIIYLQTSILMSLKNYQQVTYAFFFPLFYN